VDSLARGLAPVFGRKQVRSRGVRAARGGAVSGQLSSPPEVWVCRFGGLLGFHLCSDGFMVGQGRPRAGHYEGELDQRELAARERARTTRRRGQPIWGVRVLII